MDKLVISPLAVWNDVEGNLALFHSDTRCYFGLNSVGAAIWRHIAANREIPEVIARLTQEYDADAATIAVEVRRVAAELVQAGLLETPARPEGAPA
jgi:hypothetical protein